MATSDKAPEDGTIPVSSPDTSKILNTRQISKLSNELDGHMKGIMQVSTMLLDAARFEGSEEAVARAEKDVKELIKQLGDVAYDLSYLADEARAHFGIAEESDGEFKRKPRRRKRKPSAASLKATKKKTRSKKKAGERRATRSSSSLSSSSSSTTSDSDSDSNSGSELLEVSSSSEDSDESMEDSEDEDEGPQEDTPAITTSPHHHQDSGAGEMDIS